MPGRKKPASSKQKKAILQEKRSIKRGDFPAESILLKRAPGVKNHLSRSLAGSTVDPDARQRARQLQSRFLSVSPEYLAYTQQIAFERPLARPIPSEFTHYRSPIDREPTSDKQDKVRRLDDRLDCPKRPKWRYGVTKKELEKNEEGNFAKWLQSVDDVAEEYAMIDEETGSDDDNENTTASLQMVDRTELEVRSPSFFERNLQVWRQLWRVGEQSNIILVLMDIRCPPVHFPASLQAYLRDLVGLPDDRPLPEDETNGVRRSRKPKNAQSGRKKVILLLTKADLVEPERQAEWVQWCKRWWRYGNNVPKDEEPLEYNESTDPRIVCVESYQREIDDTKRNRHIPHIPEKSLDALISAIKEAHQDLLTPPSTIGDDADKLERWKKDALSRVKEEVEWDDLYQGDANLPSMSRNNLAEDQRRVEDVEETEPEREHEETSEDGQSTRVATCLTVGLIGQPNCGKSSLLNALLGRSRVRASKTPGKTKHFQSIYWTSDVLIVDCPGLVFPSLTNVEMQVMSGILPISQIPSVPACIYHSSRLLPLESILKLPNPPRWTEEFEQHEEEESKKTYRAGLGGPAAQRDRGYVAAWKGGDMMIGWANHRGYVTAKAGRPDTNRAGNEILRMIAEGRIPWRFLSQDASAMTLESAHGIWLERSHDQTDLVADVASEVADEGMDTTDEEIAKEVHSEAEETEEESEDEPIVAKNNVKSMFAALALEGEDSTESEEEQSAGEEA